MASEPEYWEDAIISAQLGKAARFYAVENERLTARIAALEAENRRLVEAIESVRRAWDGLTRCTDEFGDDDTSACGEWGEALDTAIIALLASASSEGRAAAAGDEEG